MSEGIEKRKFRSKIQKEYVILSVTITPLIPASLSTRPIVTGADQNSRQEVYELQENPDNRPVVAVAGATGFIGRALLPALKSHCRLICLTRSAVNEEESVCGLDVSWRQCDLFSLNDIEQVLCGADYAYYLVHSMMPSARLTQGSFQNMDLILADNFARAAALTGIKQIIYLGGLVPRERGRLSRHLDSRLEVEKTLGSYGVPVTAIRAGLIIGANGSSFSIITHLVERFKIMVLPKLRTSPCWTCPFQKTAVSMTGPFIT